MYEKEMQKDMETFCGNETRISLGLRGGRTYNGVEVVGVTNDPAVGLLIAIIAVGVVPISGKAIEWYDVA